MMKIISLAILAAGTLLHLGSCSTPLELDTPRIDSVVTASIKLHEIDVEVRSGNSNFDTTTIGSWEFFNDTLFFRSSDDPLPRISMYTELRDNPPVKEHPIVLEELYIRLTSVPAQGSVPLMGDPSKGESGVFARVAINKEDLIVTDRKTLNYQAVADLTYTATPKKRLEGTVTITLPVGAKDKLTVIARIEGSE